jgi:hypothetical protein
MKSMIVSLTILSFALCFTAFAADDPAQAGCSNATLKGSYGFYRTGFTPDGPVAAVGIIIFDGNGHSTVRQRISTNGVHEFVVTHNDIKVAADCTTKSFSEGGTLVATGVIVDNGNRVYFTGTIEGNTAYGVLDKVHQ